MGDFDALIIDWRSVYAHSSTLAFVGCLLSTTLEVLLSQQITFETRVHDGQQANCLDLILTKSQGSIEELSCLPLLDKSEHVLLDGRTRYFQYPKETQQSEGIHGEAISME
ncbi:unnamed protein product [Schistocephalus solidus]|uniref:Reverse transcriptase domain-containing protein n=1 Tax=Schistocephalus solidus TaxID=70667 RepID=A0A183SAW4_SCHSO|nr:unnamed protein product [Schistocephalus solidus]